jgi:hypothetical protein
MALRDYRAGTLAEARYSKALLVLDMQAGLLKRESFQAAFAACVAAIRKLEEGKRK